MKPIDISPKDLATVKSILDKHVPEYEVCAFGSRVTWTAKESSDFDLVVMTDKPLATMRLADLKEDFSESELPFKVDVVDWAATKEGFRKIIEKQAVPIKSLPFFSEIRLGDACEKIGSGATPRGGSGVYLDSGDISLIRSQNIYNDGFHRDGLAFISQEHADQLKNVEVKDGDVLLNITGDSVARCCQVPPDVLPARVNQHVAIIRPNEEKLQRNFLRYYMVSSVTQNKLLTMAAAGATRPALTKGMIEDLKILAPDTTTQRAIAHILGTLDDKIELNRKMNQTLEEIARALYKSWFVDFDPVKKKAAGESTGLPEEIDGLFPNEFEESELGKIPKGWKVARFNIIAQNLKEQIAPNEVDPSIPYIGLEHMPRGQIYADSWGKAEDVASGKFRFNKLQILFGKLRPYFKKVGAVPVDGICSTDILVLEPIKPIYFGLALMIATSEDFIAHSDAGSIGTKMPRTNWDLLSRYQIAVPIIDDIFAAFTEQIQSLLNGIFSRISENNNLSQARDTLLPLLLSGKLPIKDAEKFLTKAGL